MTSWKTFIANAAAKAPERRTAKEDGILKIAPLLTEEDYYPRYVRGQWVVWCASSDHAVEY